MAKDPNKPRGKISSYAFFIATCREEHKKKNPGTNVSFSEFSKKCAERWKTMSSKEKSKFEEMAKNDKVRYDREMKSYVPPKGAKKAKKKKDPNAPKRPPSAFFVFCSEFRPKVKEEYPGISIGDIAKKLGEKWSTLSAKDKGPYEAKAGKLKEKYEKVRARHLDFDLCFLMMMVCNRLFLSFFSQDMAAYKSKSGSGKGDVKKSGPGRPSAKKQEVADDDDDDDDDDDEDEEDDDDDDEDDD
uniref:High mobility group protein B2 n=1 Tax=Salarias fasciatus TaxID=181472 RepID=A0A672HTD2_SALFA